MRTVTYRGPSTGLRLDSPAGDVLDAGPSSAALGSPYTLFVGTSRGAAGARAASLDLSLPEVILLAESCMHYIAREQGIPSRVEP